MFALGIILYSGMHLNNVIKNLLRLGKLHPNVNSISLRLEHKFINRQNVSIMLSHAKCL